MIGTERDPRQHPLSSIGALALLLVGCVAPSSPQASVRPAIGVPQARAQTTTGQRTMQPPVRPVYTPPPMPVRRPAPPPPPVAPAALSATIDRLGRDFGGKLGIAVVSTDQRWSTAFNGDVPMPQQSVSKLWVAITLMDLRDQGRLTLDDPITVRPEDITLFHSPVSALVKGDGYRTTVRDLLARAMMSSDNTANDRLLNYVGGPEAVRRMVAQKGLGSIKFGPGERLLQSQTAGLAWRQEYAGRAFYTARANLPLVTRQKAFDAYVANPMDGAAASAIAHALVRLHKGELLSEGSTAHLMGLMEGSRTGKERLRGGVPVGWRFGHKTGTGQDLMGRTAGYNDVGILIAPDGRSYGLAVLIGDTRRPIRERQALMQAVVQAVVASHVAPLG